MKVCHQVALYVASVGLLGGCATGPEAAGFADVKTVALSRTGHVIQWDQRAADEHAVEESVRALLQRELTVDEAVQIALINNRNLQATYEELGIAQAELVQAGLLRNPVFDASIRFPDGGGKSNIEFGVAQNFLDLLMLPLRKKVASASFEAAKLRVSQEVIHLAMETQAAFYTVQADQQMVELRRTVVAAAEASFNAARRIHDAGNMNDLDFANEQAQYEQAKLVLAQAEVESVTAREKLNVLIGAWGQNTSWMIAQRLPELPSTEVNNEGLERWAVTERLDLAGSRQAVEVAARSLGASRPFALISEMDVGIDAERETDGQWVTGPNISVPIPLFDRGQGTIPRLQAELRRAEQQYFAKAVEVRSEVRSAWSRMVGARGRAEYYQRVIIPLRHRIVEQTQLQYNGMFVGVFQLLQAKQNEIDAGREYVEAIRDYWLARTELQRALGGRMPTRDATTQPSVQQPVPNGQTTSDQHQHHHGE